MLPPPSLASRDVGNDDEVLLNTYNTSGSLVMIVAILSRIVYNDGYSPEHLVLKESGNDPSKERSAASTH
jgi:hypothetical protein